MSFSKLKNKRGLIEIMTRKNGLGKGIEALFADVGLSDMVESGAQEQDGDMVVLPMSQIKPNHSQPRYCFDQESIKNLSESIKLNGLLQPIVVRKIGNNKFEIVAGERRFRASKLAGLKKIPAIVKNLSDQISTEFALIENLQRENLNPIEEAKGFLVLIKKYGLTQAEVAQKVGKSRSAVANSIRLLNLPEEILRFVENFQLSEGQARALLAVSEVGLMKKLAQKAIENGLSVRELERLCVSKKSVKKNKKNESNNKIYQEIEQSMKAEIRRNVKIEVVSGEKGRLIIDFYNRDDLISMAYVLANVRR